MSQQQVELAISGMTCASCANRIERKLNKLDGVSASVNYATEKAWVEYVDGVATGDLVAAVVAAGYDATPVEAADAAEESAEPGRERDPLIGRLVVAAALTVPILAIAMLAPLPAPIWPGWAWVTFVLALPVVTWSAWPFHRAALVNLRHGATTMDTLVSLGVSVSYLWSLGALLGDGDTYVEVAATVTTFLLAGRVLEHRAKRTAGEALRALMTLGAKQVQVLRDGAEVTVPVERLRVGDLFVVRPGERIATDGVVEAGVSAVDASLLTGEPVPVEVGAGEAVTGGTLNTNGRLVVRATGVGADTQLARIARLVEEAQSGKAAAQRLADRVSAYFVPAVLVLALLTFVGWLVTGGSPSTAITAAVAVLIVACPCALGLATPTALLVGTGRGAQLGVLLRGPEVLESTRRVDTVVLDKTGTVTRGELRLIEVTASPTTSEQDVRRRAAAVESASEHPIARAIAVAGRSGHAATDLPHVDDFLALPGLGAEGVVDGESVVVGRPELLRSRGLPLEPALEEAVERAEATGATAVAIGWAGAARGVLAVADTVKDGAADAVDQLRRLGLEPVLLTGDHERAARTIADEVGLETVISGVLPEEKAAHVRALQEAGRVVAMVGDGVNDAAALATADLGIAMGTGADAAIAASDLTLVRGDLRLVPVAVRLARATLRTIRANLVWAFGYNVVLIPLAASGRLEPMLAGGAMALSSLCVVGNSLRLRRFRG
ncbi:heavy metal translocating P-type ATPase [Nocardioides sp. Iso805N]|uniref:heavy metal translocating P-type ATPase n=1 Tax=Nocardioides sp. Iso805N TaxID=1283287 RepID=UPI00036F27FD|nr:heavy metal translocating P-type ATPase [Nocardioides sp. Iso805N]